MDSMKLFFECPDLNSLAVQREGISVALITHGFCAFRGLVPQNTVLREYETLSKNFRAENDIRISGPIRFKMNNFQRLDCGDYSQMYARFGRIITRFFWNPDAEFSAELKILQRVRDILLQRTFSYLDGCYDANDRRYYEMPKILQYNSGGGFMNEHYDSYNTDGLPNIGFNIIMAVTKKGTHFKTGGLYFKSLLDGTKVSLEDHLLPGDVCLTTPKVLHGVHPIDPDKPLDLKNLTGRVSLVLSSESFQAELA